jgi:hypothetical protein
MKFAAIDVQTAAAKKPPDPKDKTGDVTSNPWQKARRGKTFPKSKPILIPNTHYIRMVIPQEAALSTEQEFKDKSLSMLINLYGHLEKLDSSITLRERNQWLEGIPATTRTITIPLSLKEAIRNNHLNEAILMQFTEIYTEAKRGGKTTTYLRFCMTATRNVPELMQIIMGVIRREKSNITVGICKTREQVGSRAATQFSCQCRPSKKRFADRLKASMERQQFPLSMRKNQPKPSG